MQVATSAAATCKLRNRDWRDPPLTDPPNQFINARLDYGFIRLDPTRTPHWNAFPVDWAGTWKVANPLRFKDRIQVVGYPDPNGTGQGQLETLSTNDLTILPDFYHQKLNRISTKHISFTKGTSGGAWLDVKNPHAPKIVSLTSAYVGVPVDANAGQYITIYGPILHQDAMTLAAAAGDDSQTTGYSDCQ
jgi:hypothetical protein